MASHRHGKQHLIIRTKQKTQKIVEGCNLTSSEDNVAGDCVADSPVAVGEDNTDFAWIAPFSETAT